MKKVFYATIAMFVVMAIAVVGFSGTMMVSADDIPEFGDNIARTENGVGFASSIYDDGNKGTQYLNDGEQNDSNYWQPDGTDLNAPYYAGIYWETAKPFNTIVVEFKHIGTEGFSISATYATENAAITEAKTAGNRAFMNAAEGVAYKSGLVEGVDYTITPYETGDAAKPVYVITFATPVTSKMVKIDLAGYFSDGCAQAPTEIYEIEVYNTAAADEAETIGDGTVTAETDSVSGVKSVFVATNVAEADVPAGASIKASFIITVDGQTGTGEKLITAAYTSIALGDETVTAANITGADAADYVTGILFNNVPENATIEVVFTVAE